MSSNPNLFDELPAFLPCWTPGETLFSWSARYHRLRGGGPAMRSSQQLFGCSKAGLRHDLPSHLDRFVSITGGLMGTPESIALERTLLQYYAPFLKTEDLTRSVNLMRGESVSKLKNLLGILPSRVGARHPLKGCDECVKADRSEHGVSLWHLEHQWPSSWICRAHGIGLKQLGDGVSAVGYEKWLLPEDVPSSAWVTYSAAKGIGASTLRKVVDVTAGFIASRNVAFDVRLLRYTYLTAARSKNWLAPDGSLRLSEVREAFIRCFHVVAEIRPFAFVHTVHDVNAGVIGLLMRQHPGRRHPLKHGLAVAFLFESFEEFLGAYQRAQQIAEEVGPDNIHRLLAMESRARLRRMVEDEHKSVSAAARALCVSEGLANQWARKDHVKYAKRPRVLTPPREKELRLLLEEGQDYETIGSDLSMRKSFVRSYAAKDPTLRQLWRQARIDETRSRHRRCFLDIANAHPGWSIKALRRLPGNGVSWLVRNDPSWLTEQVSKLGLLGRADARESEK